jgi:protein-S-isoprenylcysteine O-methyltransferase Ste14
MSEDAARILRAHLYGTLVIGIFVVIPVLYLRRLDPWLPFGLPDVLRYPGFALLLAGAALSYASFFFFLSDGKGTAFPTDPPKTLVIRGPYVHVRNPMYTGNLAIIFGAAFWFASPADLLYAVVMCFVTHVYITTSEEPILVRRYQELYLNYVRTTPRWLPGLGRGASPLGRNRR